MSIDLHTDPPDDTDNTDASALHDLIERVVRLEEGKADKEHFHTEYAPVDHTHEEYATHDEIPVALDRTTDVTRKDIDAVRDELYNAIDAIDLDLSDSIGKNPSTEIEGETDKEPMNADDGKRLRLLW